MKSLEELAAIRERMKPTVALRDDKAATRVVVGMGTAGIAAGARAVLSAFVQQVAEAGLQHVMVLQDGTLTGADAPLVQVQREGEAPVTYTHMTPDRAAEVVKKHLAGGTPVAEYTAPAAH